jgi:hypothetical protein
MSIIFSQNSDTLALDPDEGGGGGGGPLNGGPWPYGPLTGTRVQNQVFVNVANVPAGDHPHWEFIHWYWGTDLWDLQERINASSSAPSSAPNQIQPLQVNNGGNAPGLDMPDTFGSETLYIVAKCAHET